MDKSGERVLVQRAWQGPRLAPVIGVVNVAAFTPDDLLNDLLDCPHLPAAFAACHSASA